MSDHDATIRPARRETFRHEAMLYGDLDQFVARVVTFVEGARAAAEPVLVAVAAPKIDLLRAAMAGNGDGVEYVDMVDLGANPARIIPAWRQFVDERSPEGRPVRGIGEPIWAGRSPAALAESQRHEELLNLALRADPLWLLCPYDTSSLESAVIHEARCSHPWVDDGDGESVSAEYRGLDPALHPFTGELPAAPVGAFAMDFDEDSLPAVRRHLSRHAASMGLSVSRCVDLALAGHEVAANSIEHGGGCGRLRLWRSGRDLICEIEDAGEITWPLAGRVLPAPEQPGGRGLYLANQLCDLVQIRSGPGSTTVRIHLHVDG